MDCGETSTSCQAHAGTEGLMCARRGTELQARWLEREDARTRLRGNPSDRNLRKALKTAKKHLKRARAEGLQRFFEECVSQLEVRIREGDQFGFYKHLKEMDVEGKRT